MLAMTLVNDIFQCQIFPYFHGPKLKRYRKKMSQATIGNSIDGSLRCCASTKLSDAFAANKI